MPSDPQRPRLIDLDQAQRLLTMAIDPQYLGTPTALMLCCDAQSRPLGHIHLLRCALDCAPSDLSEILDSLVERAGLLEPTDLAGIALALTRPGGNEIQPYDRAWFRALYRVCHRRRLTPIGVYVVTRSGARAVTIDDAA